jgi:phosphonoacetaldehyde hydrolase
VTRLGAVIVDWAGTIMDFGSCAPAGAFVELFRRHGVTITLDEARGPMGTAKRDHIAALLAGRERFGLDLDELYAEFIPLQLACLPDFAALIPGAAAAVAGWRARGLRVGGTTGYSRDMVEICIAAARRQGLELDSVKCASDVRAGRPAPWMALAAAAELGVYPMVAIVKIGDTRADIDEGLNAGMWTIGVTATGNELGLNEAAAAALPAPELDRRVEAIGARFRNWGAHYVARSVADCLPIFDEIDARLARGDRP